jgi:hypothetical protein
MKEVSLESSINALKCTNVRFSIGEGSWPLQSQRKLRKKKEYNMAKNESQMHQKVYQK